MTFRLHVLCDGMRTLNGQAFCFPLLQQQGAIERKGIKLRLYHDPEGSFRKGDILAVERKYCSNVSYWGENKTHLFFKELQNLGKPLVFFDTSDSSGRIWNSVLENVDLYIKNQLLSDRERYLSDFYDEVDYADYYSRCCSTGTPRSEPKALVRDRAQLRKLAVGWNSGLSDHTREGRKRLRWAGLLLRRLNQRIASKFLVCPTVIQDPDINRAIDLHCRMKLHYDPPSFSLQRRLISDRIGNIDTNKIGRKRYFSELKETWAVLSPFGYGEITLKDFESFLCGNLLIKPSMSHMDTWPPLYCPEKTYVPIQWDLSDMRAVLEDTIRNRAKYVNVVQEGQKNYTHYLNDLRKGNLFVNHFVEILNPIL